jgi:hypothetical protein
MRDWAESARQNQIRVGGNSVAIAEAHQRNHHRPLHRFLETANDELPQFVNVELGGVDHHVGELADRLHQHALAAQSFAHRTIVPQRVRPARLAEPAQQGFFAGFDKTSVAGFSRAQLLIDRGNF